MIVHPGSREVVSSFANQESVSTQHALNVEFTIGTSEFSPQAALSDSVTLSPAGMRSGRVTRNPESAAALCALLDDRSCETLVLYRKGPGDQVSSHG
jgi:hypothetical protein